MRSVFSSRACAYASALSAASCLAMVASLCSRIRSDALAGLERLDGSGGICDKKGGVGAMTFTALLHSVQLIVHNDQGDTRSKQVRKSQ